MQKVNTTFNRFRNMPYIPYNIMIYLANEPKAENLFKILKYPTMDCLSQLNLTLEEKMSMIWLDSPQQQDFYIFFTPKVENMEASAKTYIKLYNVEIVPTDVHKAIVCYEFDLQMKGKIDVINVPTEYGDIPCNRVEVMQQIILECLNGADVKSVGGLQFSNQLSRLCRGRNDLSNNKDTVGSSLIMAVMVVDISAKECQAVY